MLAASRRHASVAVGKDGGRHAPERSTGSMRLTHFNTSASGKLTPLHWSWHAPRAYGATPLPELGVARDHEPPVLGFLQVAFITVLHRIDRTGGPITIKARIDPATGLLLLLVLPHQDDHVLLPFDRFPTIIPDSEILDDEPAPLRIGTACPVGLHGLGIHVDVVNAVEEGVLVGHHLLSAFLPLLVPLWQRDLLRCRHGCRGKKGDGTEKGHDNSSLYHLIVPPWTSGQRVAKRARVVSKKINRADRRPDNPAWRAAFPAGSRRAAPRS